ncbi:MAG: hypothetical protein IT340_12415 [Chloroflexi bacterium]|nr:hypothetical protein [Chloroflexota bacterium]
MIQALLLTMALVAVAGLLTVATGSRWPMALLMAGLLGQSLLRLDWRRDIVGPFRRIRPRHLLVGLAALLLPFTVFLLTADVPLLNWSLLSLLGASETGNVAGAGLQVGIWFAVPYALLLLACLPALALIEEYWFRRGTRGWRDGLGRSLAFGLVHMLVGVPLGVALLGLAPVGLLFTAVYLRAARREPAPGDPPPAFGHLRFAISEAERRGIDASALQHLAYNTIAVTLAMAALLLEPLAV